ncbi:hypothetical protein ACFVIM_29970 [Streptomyces sp. NPDC057638]|uniref:hypothetical protein n=1 Tax=Streptomyces sp. NPDC057638 TaxID=3346190 RepID=UPI00369F3237
MTLSTRSTRGGIAALLGVLALLLSTLLPVDDARAAPPTAPTPQAVTPPTAPTPVATTPLPGSKANWTVSLGGLRPLSQGPSFVRLGYYTFAGDGTVAHEYWQWSHTPRFRRVDAVSADCGGAIPHCDVKTAEGFTGPPTGRLGGSYVYTPGADGPDLVITWRNGTPGGPPAGSVERWRVETGLAGGTLARMRSGTFYRADGLTGNTLGTVDPDPAFSDYGADHGIGYGSNAPFSSRQSMASLAASETRFRGNFLRVTDGTAPEREWTGGDFTFGGRQGNNVSNPWRLCSNGSCMGFLQHNTRCNRNAASNTQNPRAFDPDRVRYLAELGTGRQNTGEYWCQLLAWEEDCYQGNSHVQPMLQVLGDDGGFLGWVGVEASPDYLQGQPANRQVEDFLGIFDNVSVEIAHRNVYVTTLVDRGTGASPPLVVEREKPAPAFRIAYGNSTMFGHLTWEDRTTAQPFTTVRYSGRNRPASGCRFAEFIAYAASGKSVRETTRHQCAGGADYFDPDFAAVETRPPLAIADRDVARVQITYWVSEDGGRTYSTKGVQNCTVGGCVDSTRDPQTQFRVGHGQSVAAGTLTWKGQAISYEGNNHVASGCRYVLLVASDGTRHSSSDFCATNGDRPFSSPQFATAATSVDISYWVSDNGGAHYAAASTRCTRDGCV